ncbi:Transmembrane protein [Entamoeba marina]
MDTIQFEELISPIVDGSPQVNNLKFDEEDEDEEELILNSKEDYLDLLIQELYQHYTKIRLVAQYSILTHKYTKKNDDVHISVIFAVNDCSHIFEYLLFVKLTHIILCAPRVRSIPPLGKQYNYIILGACSVISISALSLFQKTLSFPIQSPGQSMKFLSVICLRPFVKIPLKQRDLILGSLMMICILMFVVVSETDPISVILLLTNIVFDSLVGILQSKHFIIEEYHTKLFYSSLSTSIIFCFLAYFLQSNLMMEHPLLCIAICITSASTHISNALLQKNTRGVGWMNYLNVLRQFFKLCYTFIWLQAYTPLQFIFASLVFLCLFIHDVSYKLPNKNDLPDSLTFTL